MRACGSRERGPATGFLVLRTTSFLALLISPEGRLSSIQGCEVKGVECTVIEPGRAEVELDLVCVLEPAFLQQADLLQQPDLLNVRYQSLLYAARMLQLASESKRNKKVPARTLDRFVRYVTHKAMDEYNTNWPRLPDNQLLHTQLDTKIAGAFAKKIRRYRNSRAGRKAEFQELQIRFGSTYSDVDVFSIWTTDQCTPRPIKKKNLFFFFF
ncbi:hypothetical protein GNI_041930 [Gregarina niphandrodes]|uniref:Uncharacterized protein n=1 Tax=Gregarina niphandrodes TaxID=110365 RepID=A0A023BA82_GRENI|nr:hypothetical protein GNI_041930 [Gregarina niphandrodes]EZG77551.1 hypothetical protein GNI_041930 [Gregarina niphandrodes]|eukprot:XP_011129496.1 hypothetical protein GNI_041930 [Gregarina niphandrodes]